jgi:hypothetical protein
MSFLGCNILSSKIGGSNIYQPFGGNTRPLICDYSIYSNGITTIKIPFVEEGQRPEDEYFSLGGEGILMQNGGNGFDTLDLEGVLILVGELV